jgi:hypothetical protein
MKFEEESQEVKELTPSEAIEKALHIILELQQSNNSNVTSMQGMILHIQALEEKVRVLSEVVDEHTVIFKAVLKPVPKTEVK